MKEQSSYNVNTVIGKFLDFNVGLNYKMSREAHR